MLAIEITETPEGNYLTPCQREQPAITENEVLIKVEAAGVNRPDIMQRQGLYPPPPGASDIPGLEVAGTVIAIGNKVRQWQIGDQVCALVTGGGYAEYCAASEQLCLPVPEGINLVQAAGLPETFFTVWSNLFDRGQLSAGESILIHGGSSGIGTTAVQMAKAFGASVFITAGNDDKCAFCTELGADLAINYTQQDFVSTIKQHTDNKGVNVILDMIGGNYLPRNLKCLAIDGRLLQIAIQNGAKSEINLAAVMLKRLSIIGSTLRARDVNFKARIAQSLYQNIWPLLTSGQIKPIIDSTFPLTEANKAQQHMESSQHIGKIILTVSI